MTDIIISNKKEDEEKKLDVNDIRESLKLADEYKKIKEMNDKLEEEYKRSDEIIKARGALGGRAFAGQYIPQKTPEEISKEEAAKILSMFR